MAVWNIFPTRKLIFGHFWNCKKWNLVKKNRQIDLFDFTSSHNLDNSSAGSRINTINYFAISILYRTTKLVGLLDQFLVCEILDYDEIKFCRQMYHKWNPNQIQWKLLARSAENSIGSANEMIPEFAFKNNLGTNLPCDIILF